MGSVRFNALGTGSRWFFCAGWGGTAQPVLRGCGSGLTAKAEVGKSAKPGLKAPSKAWKHKGPKEQKARPKSAKKQGLEAPKSQAWEPQKAGPKSVKKPGPKAQRSESTKKLSLKVPESEA